MNVLGFTSFIFLFLVIASCFCKIYTRLNISLTSNVTFISKRCLYIPSICRFSNNIIEFLRGVQLAKQYYIRRIEIDSGFMGLNRSFYYENIHVVISSSHYKCVKTITLFQLPNLSRLRLDEPVEESFIDMIYRKLPKVHIPPNSLVIHIRSGDIFYLENPHPSYSQPPCNFYLDAIHMKKWSKVILIAEDDFNPCVNIVKKHVTLYKRQSWEKDLAFLMNAENLVVSQGTVWIAISFLSKSLKKLYIFDHPQPQIKDHMNCVANDEWRELFKKWKKTEEQLNAMKTAKCVKWEFIKHRPQMENDSYVWEDLV